MVARAPRKRMYRTMQGRYIDIEKLRGANEDARAVGNMNVNARGDVLSRGGQVVQTKQQVVKKYYEMPRGRVDDTPAHMRQTPAPQPQPKIIESKPAPQPKVTRQPRTKTTSTPKKGIDAALDGLE